MQLFPNYFELFTICGLASIAGPIQFLLHRSSTLDLHPTNPIKGRTRNLPLMANFVASIPYGFCSFLLFVRKGAMDAKD